MLFDARVGGLCQRKLHTRPAWTTDSGRDFGQAQTLDTHVIHRSQAIANSNLPALVGRPARDEGNDDEGLSRPGVLLTEDHADTYGLTWPNRRKKFRQVIKALDSCGVLVITHGEVPEDELLADGPLR